MVDTNTTDTWAVSMGPELTTVEKNLARATAGTVYNTYVVSPDGTGRQERYNLIVTFLRDNFGATLELATDDQAAGTFRTQWQNLIIYLESTPPFNNFLWPYKKWGLKARMRRSPSPPVATSAAGNIMENVVACRQGSTGRYM